MNALTIRSLNSTFALLLLSTHLLYAQSANYAIMPKPAKLVEQKGAFTLTNATAIVLEKENADLRRVATMVADRMGTATGNRPAIRGRESGWSEHLFCDG